MPAQMHFLQWTTVLYLPSPRQVHNSTMRLIDGRVGVRAAAGIGIGNCNKTKVPTADHMRPLSFWNVGIEEGVIFRRVAMGPAVHGDGGDIAGGVKSSLPQGAEQLVADVAFKS